MGNIESLIEKYSSEYGEFPPHWIIWPKSHPYSIIWKQGSGEEYVEMFIEWFEENCKTETERVSYFLKYSPPPRWLGTVVELIWDIEPEGDFDYSEFFQKLARFGFIGMEMFEVDLSDEKWFDNQE